MIPVTKSFLPNIDDYLAQVRRAYDNEWLTNRGELVVELEEKIQHYLNSISKPLIMNNGTIPLQIALKILGEKGEIITTPFSYVATTSSILWENCKPVFVDIHPEYLTVNETKIEAAITKDTKCILLTHVFGNPCDVQYIEQIAKKYGLYVIYDAAHCFGVKYRGKSIFDFGDISTCSFHATKLFHTGEGGAAFVNDNKLYRKVYYSHNFGHNGPLDFHGLGINGKISELNSAMGLAVFPYLDQIISERKKIVDFYKENLNFKHYRCIKLREETEWNYSYFPIIFETEDQLINVQKKLNDNDIFPRRYFYPSLNTLPFIDNLSECEVSEKISKTIMCIPLYVGLEMQNQQKIIEIINGVLHK
jgi:dTDP-4-amino-4,6-dideoxygalactose transaminase